MHQIATEWARAQMRTGIPGAGNTHVCLCGCVGEGSNDGWLVIELRYDGCVICDGVELGVWDVGLMACSLKGCWNVVAAGHFVVMVGGCVQRWDLMVRFVG